MTLDFYKKLPDWFPKKEKKIRVIAQIIQALSEAGFTSREANEVLDSVRDEIGTYAASIPIAELQKAAPASEES